MSKTLNSLKAIGEFVSLCTPIILALFAYLQLKVTKKVTAMSDKQDIIHEQINGMKDQLVKTTKDAGLAEGNLQGRIEQTKEQKEQNK